MCAMLMTFVTGVTANADDDCYVWVRFYCEDAPNASCDNNNCRITSSVPIYEDMDGDGIDETYVDTSYTFKCNTLTDSNEDGVIDGNDTPDRPWGSYDALFTFSDCVLDSFASLLMGDGLIEWMGSESFDNAANEHDFNGDGVLSDGWDKNIQYCWKKAKCSLDCNQIEQHPNARAVCEESPGVAWEDDTGSKKDESVCWSNASSSSDCGDSGYYYYYGY